MTDYENERAAMIEGELSSWSFMASSLREENRVLMEKMLSESKEELKAMTYSGKDTFESLAMVLIFRQQKMIKDLIEKIEKKGT